MGAEPPRCPMSGMRTTQGPQPFRCINAREGAAHVAECRQRLVLEPHRVRQRPGECASATLACGEQPSALSERRRRIPRAQRLDRPAMPRHDRARVRVHGAQPLQRPEQGGRYERHVPREHHDRDSVRRGERGRNPRQWSEASHLIGDDALAREPRARRRIIGDDELRRGGEAQRRQGAVGNAGSADRRQSLGFSPETTRGAPCEEDADTRFRNALAGQMRRPRCSAAISSSSVSARSTMSDSSPRRGRSFRKRPQLLHITRS